MPQFIATALLLVLPTLVPAEDRLPTPDYHRQPSDPVWLAQVVQLHGHLGPSVVAGARMGMIGLHAVGAKGYFDVEVTCEGPLAQPPQACFLDGIQAATGATLGKRTLNWTQADKLVVRVKNTQTGNTVELRPTPALLGLLASFKPEAKAGTGHGPSQQDHEQLEQIARRIAAMPDSEVAIVTLGGEVAKDTRESQAIHTGNEDYKLGPDSMRHEGVPKGTVTKSVWHSKIYPDTVRDYYSYVPAQYDEKTPACVMVFQDGHAYVSETGEFRVPVVFDNLIHKGEMPVTIGIFIDPGHLGSDSPGNRWQASNRSFEYDSLSDQYARFLLEEMLPEVGKTYKLTDDPERRAICGISSGGICAFTVAWQRPDAFRKVLSHVGSFTNIRGGHVYPSAIRSSSIRPLRVFLQDGSNDLDNAYGNWWLANQEMAAALKFRGYDYKFVGGTGTHGGKHGGAILPDSLRWLWRDRGLDKPRVENAAGQVSDVVAKIRRVVPPWHPFQEPWAAEATVILTATYKRVHLPCIEIAPGALAMPWGHAFEVTGVFKGEVQSEEIVSGDLGQEGERFPDEFVDGRSYLVFLKPSKDTLQRMHRPDVKFVRLADVGDEVVAVIDLSQGKAEAEAVRVQATRSGDYQAFHFTPEKWASLCNAKKIDLELQKQLVPFLQNVVLAKGATLGQVRSYLGKPNYHSVSTDGISYHYNFNSGAEVPHGEISGSLWASFTPGLALDGYKIEFARCEVSRNGITSVSWTILSDDEHKRLGLPLIRSKMDAQR